MMPFPPAPSRLIDTLTDLNLDDLLEAGGCARWRHTPLHRPLTRLLRPAARRFASVMCEFDHRVGQQGLAQGSAWVLHRMAGGVQVSGIEHVPATGPVFVLANHPGMVDAVALLASLAFRPDLRVIALDRPFLRALPNVAKHLIFVPEDAGARLRVVRDGVRHLQRGGALLTFPAGHIEPDPALRGPAVAIRSLADWSDSFALFARQVPQTRCVPALISHVISPAALAHPLTRLRRSDDGRQKLAAALQVSMRRYQSTVAQLRFGPPIGVQATGTPAIAAQVIAQLQQLIEASFGDRVGRPRVDIGTPPLCGSPAVGRGAGG
jgi:1-acyl-sn-glycerol-3-phosphate acyltransferase